MRVSDFIVAIGNTDDLSPAVYCISFCNGTVLVEFW